MPSSDSNGQLSRLGSEDENVSSSPLSATHDPSNVYLSDGPFWGCSGSAEHLLTMSIFNKRTL